MDLLLVVFFIVHAYLFVISVWHGILLILHRAESDMVPEYVQLLFDKDDGEATAVAAGSTCLLVCLGCCFELGLLARHPLAHASGLIFAFLCGIGVFFGCLSGFFFLDWRQTARANAAPPPPE